MKHLTQELLGASQTLVLDKGYDFVATFETLIRIEKAVKRSFLSPGNWDGLTVGEVKKIVLACLSEYPEVTPDLVGRHITMKNLAQTIKTVMSSFTGPEGFRAPALIPVPAMRPQLTVVN